MKRETKAERLRRIAYALRQSFGHVAPEPTLTIPISAWMALAWQAYKPGLCDDEIALRAIDAVFANREARQ